jgi:hypothetical protein
MRNSGLLGAAIALSVLTQIAPAACRHKPRRAHVYRFFPLSPVARRRAQSIRSGRQGRQVAMPPAARRQSRRHALGCSERRPEDEALPDRRATVRNPSEGPNAKLRQPKSSVQVWPTRSWPNEWWSPLFQAAVARRRSLPSFRSCCTPAWQEAAPIGSISLKYNIDLMNRCQLV